MDFLQSSFSIGSLKLPNRLIQGPLAGYSAAPLRQLCYQFMPPAYAVSEMISSHDILYKHQPQSRYLYRAPDESLLCYQLAGNNPEIMAKAAIQLEHLGADLIDINCGCPKTKIRQKGAGSALLSTPETLCAIVRTVRDAIQIPLTVKLRIQGTELDMSLAQSLEHAGADALIIHGRRWMDDYDTPCNYKHINQIKRNVHIPVIANGDITNKATLTEATTISECDAYMVARGGCGNPWVYQQLLSSTPITVDNALRIQTFLTHIHGLSQLESEHQAVMQSRSLIRYYFRNLLSLKQLSAFYALNSLYEIEDWVSNAFSSIIKLSNGNLLSSPKHSAVKIINK